MYEFHHDYTKNKYGNKAELLFTDNNSLINEVKLKMFMKISQRQRVILLQQICKKNQNSAMSQII